MTTSGITSTKGDADIERVKIPAGEFLMGSSEGEGSGDEHPQHRVYLDACYISKYEITNEQFICVLLLLKNVTSGKRDYIQLWREDQNVA